MTRFIQYKPVENVQFRCSRQAGVSILEVVIGIFIFIVGLLALSALQGALTRSMVDAKVRTNAANIAEVAIESNRSFTRLATDTANGVFAYNDIVDSTSTSSVDGVSYTVAIDVTDYFYQLATDTYSTTANGGIASDYKQMEVTVSWDASQNFRADEGAEMTAAKIGSGSIKLTSVIPAIITAASARVANATYNGDVSPPVTYTPGQRPDIVSLSLGNNKFKESLTPEPDVIRAEELVETRFDVITYSQNNSGAQFLRREEFASVSCECTLKAADSSNLGRRPVVWAGDEYAGGHFVEKPYGISANNQQSSLCDSCCRDHHDGGSSGDDHSTDSYYNVFSPFRGSSEYLSTPRDSDHKHYKSDGVTQASNDEEYLEACRLVRVDGYFRVAQDFRREDQYIFPANYLDNANEINTYSTQVTNAAAAYAGAVSSGYPTNPPCIGDNGNNCLADPTQDDASPNMQGAYSEPIAIDAVTGNPESLPSWTIVQDGGIEEQQLRSRGVYIDYISNDLRSFLSTCIVNGALVDGCSVGDVMMDESQTANPLEILPFFEVQMTHLDNWTQTVRATLPISLSNEALRDSNSHSRGEISREVSGSTDVTAKSHRGNIGFTNTLAIDPYFNAQVRSASLNVQSLDEGGSGSTGGGGTMPTVISGDFTESVRGSPTIEVRGVGGAVCTLEPKGYSCSVEAGSSAPQLIVEGYEDTKKTGTETRYACSTMLSGLNSTAPGNTYTAFWLINGEGEVLPRGVTYHIVIQASPCTF